MNVYVIESSNEDTEVDVSLYYSKLEALQHACFLAVDHMSYLNCFNPSAVPVSWHKAYCLIQEQINQKKYRDALDQYNRWMDTIEDTDCIYRIYVYERKIVGNPTNHKDNVVNNSANKLPDVPCKQCGRNVNTSENMCWYCGVSFPAINNGSIT